MPSPSLPPAPARPPRARFMLATRFQSRVAEESTATKIHRPEALAAVGSRAAGAGLSHVADQQAPTHR